MSEHSDSGLERRPELDKPVLICSFRGWNDGGQGASLASAFLSRVWKAEPFADIDPSSSSISSRSGLTSPSWTGACGGSTGPKTASTRRGSAPGVAMPFSCRYGAGLRWRTFAGLVSGLAQRPGRDPVVTLGSLLADVPHTRPPR